jgi:hypothetical protein
MPDFPAFMKNPVNRIDLASRHTPGMEGRMYADADGRPITFRTYRETTPFDGGILAACPGVGSGSAHQTP